MGCTKHFLGWEKRCRKPSLKDSGKPWPAWYLWLINEAYLILYPCVYSGSRTGHIHHHDVRVAEHHVATLAGHTQEVCGLKWALDGRYLASGGNDNLVNIWSNTQGDNGWLHPVQTFTQHQGAVKVSRNIGVDFMLYLPWLQGCLSYWYIYFY